jgi:hypothetical protein
VQAALGSLDIQHAVDHDGGTRLSRVGGPTLQPVQPRRAELANVALVDLSERRVALIAEVASDHGKVGIGRFAAAGRLLRMTAAAADIVIRVRDESHPDRAQHGRNCDSPLHRYPSTRYE